MWRTQNKDVCENDVRSWMDRCLRVLGGSPIRWPKLSAGRKMVRDRHEPDDQVIEAIVEEISRALA